MKKRIYYAEIDDHSESGGGLLPFRKIINYDERLLNPFKTKKSIRTCPPDWMIYELLREQTHRATISRICVRADVPTSLFLCALECERHDFVRMSSSGVETSVSKKE